MTAAPPPLWQRARTIGQALTPPLLVLAVFAVFLLSIDHRRSLNYWPRFDAIEYAVSAANTLRHGQPALLIGNHFYPARTLLGYPAFLTPQLLLNGGQLTRLYFTTILFGIASLVLFYFFIADLTRSRRTGFLAALMLASAPLFVRFSVLVMADAPALLPLIGIHWLWLRILRRQDTDPLPWLGLGLLAGYLGIWRITYAIPFFVFVGHFAIWGPGQLQDRVKTLSYALCAFGLPQALSATYNMHYYGSPFATEHSRLWDPAWNATLPDYVPPFSWRNIIFRLHDGRPAGNLFYYAFTIAGLTAPKVFIALPLFLAAVFGGFRLRRRWPAAAPERVCWRTWALGALGMLGAFLCYVGQQERFLNFLLLPLALLAAIGLTPYTAKRITDKTTRWATNGALIVFAAGIVIFHLLLLRDPRERQVRAPQPRLDIIAQLRDAIDEGAVVFTNDSPALIHHALGGRNHILPFLQNDPFPEQIYGGHANELLSHHVFAIDHFNVPPLAEWRPGHPLTELEFLIPHTGHPNHPLLDKLKAKGIKCYLLLIQPNVYFSHPLLQPLTAHLTRIATTEYETLTLYELKPF